MVVFLCFHSLYFDWFVYAAHIIPAVAQAATLLLSHPVRKTYLYTFPAIC